MTRILLVEADEAQAQALHESLHKHADWEVTRVRSVLEAIRTAGDATFDAAVLDYDLPDGTGLDLLDFLRIGSPGIGIVMLSGRRSEDVAFQALSHGVGDYLVKDQHLERELPLRVAQVLDHVDPHVALVETLGPHTYDDVRVRDEDEDAPSDLAATTRLDAALAGLVGGHVLAAGAWDHRGRELAVRLLPDLDEEGLGFAVATIHGQLGALWTYGQLKPVGYNLLIDVEGGLLGVTAIPGTFLVAMLFDDTLSRARCLARLERGAARIHEALQA